MKGWELEQQREGRCWGARAEPTCPLLQAKAKPRARGARVKIQNEENSLFSYFTVVPL